jgi:hypothetical protein
MLLAHADADFLDDVLEDGEGPAGGFRVHTKKCNVHFNQFYDFFANRSFLLSLGFFSLFFLLLAKALVGFLTGFATKLCIAALGLELNSALGVLADVSVDVCTRFHAYRTLPFERFGEMRPLFRSSTKPITSPKSPHNGFELCPAGVYKSRLIADFFSLRAECE